ncbi:MAG TPA: class I SAM-dependent methyltransferase [Chitinophagaceae bacterium]|nr:class I SAM-dependent methyltransferase [Chitinophagaceae bacterium]
MSPDKEITEPDNTAVRTALWRALHMQVDAKPHIIEDEIGLKLAAPVNDWQQRPDMKFTKRLRASIVARARFVEDLVIEESKKEISQYVILGAGLDTFIQRRADIASRMQVFEIDRPATLAWKQQRLTELGFGMPEYLHFVPVNFEASSWWKELSKAGFDNNQPALVACTGVSLYLTREAIVATLNKIATFTTGSKLAMTFYLPTELLDEEDKPVQEIAMKGAAGAGTPMISFFTPGEILTLAREAGFKEAKTISTQDMEQYFTNRTDGLLPASGEVFLLAAT